MDSKQKPVIFIVGTTASGKTEWALRLAREFGGVIINCDSVQVYQKLDIGAAKPTREEQEQVQHYLLDYVAPPREMTAGQYCRDFYECMESLPAGIPIFVVGGTGFYFMAIEKGMYPVLPVSPEIQKAVAAEMETSEGASRLYQELQQKDPEYGAKIHSSDKYRIGRAIELIRSQGKGVTEIQKEFSSSQQQFPFPLLKIGLKWDREILKERIQQRTLGMIEKGLIEEVRRLLTEGLESWLPMGSVGYRETIQFVKNQISKSELIEAIATNSRQLAKRQRTWFQRDPEIHWLDGAEGFATARDLVEKFLIPFDAHK